MHLFYKSITAVLAITGCISMSISGALNPAMFLAGLGMLPGYYRFFRGEAQASRSVIGGLAVSALFVFLFDALIMTGDLFIAVAHLTIIFQAIKSFDLKDPWDHIQVYFMSLLQMIIASELTRSIVFGLVFVFFLVAFVTAMVLSHFLREKTLGKIRVNKTVAVISLITLLATALFFISTPRIRGGLWGKSRTPGIKTAGFSEKVDFGSFGNVLLDPTIIMRVEITGNPPRPFYWRGMTLDYFDGTSWTNTLKERFAMRRQDDLFRFMPFSMDKADVQRIYLEPIESEVIFGLTSIAALDVQERNLLVDRSGAFFIQGKTSRRTAYSVYSIPEEQRSYKLVRQYLQTPSYGIDRITALTRDITKGLATDYEKAVKIEGYLKNNYRYSLSTQKPSGSMNPIDDFIFNSKKGFCEHFATAMVLMLRSIGIPSRMVTGFAGGDENKYGGYLIVRQGNAHSLVEAMMEQRWKRFDPTPSAAPLPMPSVFSLYLDVLRLNWYRYVVSFSSADQERLVSFFSMPLIFRPGTPDIEVSGIRPLIYLAVSMATALLLVLFLKGRRYRRYNYVTANYLKFRDKVKKLGGAVALSSTISEVMSEALKKGCGPAEDIREFLKLYEEMRFSGREINAGRKEKYIRLFRTLLK